jgi:hypothetical protein
VPNHLYPPIGKCIYCGETKLPVGVSRFGDEHIIPLALGGNLILQESSCRKCEKIINREIETPVCSHEWGYLRAKREFPTRNKKKRLAKTHIIVQGVDGSPMRIPVADYSAPVTMYKFGEARILSGLGPGVDDLRWTVVILTSCDEEMGMQRKYPGWDKIHRPKAQPYPFARLLAKIAYAYVVAEYGLGAFAPLVTDIILGRSDDYFYTVGGSWDIAPIIPGGDHVTNITVRGVGLSRMLIVVDIRLFSVAETPSYHVVVGEVDSKNPEHVTALEKHRLDGKIVQIPFKVG